MKLKTKSKLRYAREIMLGLDSMPAAFRRFSILFIHIPKCAGSSVCMQLFGHQVGHRTIAEYNSVPRVNLSEYYKFTISREPLERSFSAFNFLKAGGLTKSDKMWAESNRLVDMGFDEFIETAYKNRRMLDYLHFYPQHKFIERYRMGPVAVDKVYRLSELYKCEEDLSQILAKPIAFEKKNTKNKVMKNSSVSEITKNKITDIYNRDYWLLGYDL